MKKDKSVYQLYSQKIGNQLHVPNKVNNFSFLKKLLTITILPKIPVIQALIALVNDPEPEHPLRTDLAEEYIKDRKKFFKNAEDYTKKFAEKRPSD